MWIEVWSVTSKVCFLGSGRIWHWASANGLCFSRFCQQSKLFSDYQKKLFIKHLWRPLKVTTKTEKWWTPVTFWSCNGICQIYAERTAFCFLHVACRYPRFVPFRLFRFWNGNFLNRFEFEQLFAFRSFIGYF